MSFYRYLPIPLVCVGTVFLTGALSISSNPDPPILTSNVAVDPKAVHLLQQTLERLTSVRDRWLECKFHQQVRLSELNFEAEGRYIQSPGNRFRTELRTRQGESLATLVAVSDGTHLTQAHRIGSERWIPVANRHGSATLASGIVVLVHDLSERFTWIRHEPVNSGKQIRLVGLWKRGQLTALVPDGTQWPEELPALCRVSLDAQTLWPARIEWWRPALAGGQPKLLVELDFEAPVFERTAKSDDAQLFTLDLAH